MGVSDPAENSHFPTFWEGLEEEFFFRRTLPLPFPRPGAPAILAACQINLPDISDFSRN